MKVMQPLIAPDGQVWIHESCLMTEEAFWPDVPPRHNCGEDGEWLKVYVEKEEKRDGQ